MLKELLRENVVGELAKSALSLGFGQGTAFSSEKRRIYDLALEIFTFMPTENIWIAVNVDMSCIHIKIAL